MSYGTGRGVVFETFMSMQGQTIIVHRNFNLDHATSFQTKGLKTTIEKSSSVVFRFPDQLDMPVGSVLQLEGGRDYWKIRDTEDIFEADKFIYCEARVEKINLSGQPLQLSSPIGGHFTVNGPNARISIQSQDYSTNISHQVEEKIFSDMRQVIQNHVQNEGEKVQSLNKLNDMEMAKGTESFMGKYQSFIASAANHMSALAPFIPALTKLLGG